MLKTMVYEYLIGIVLSSNHNTNSMPIGDPGGGIFTYTSEGLPEQIFAVTIPSKDVSKSTRFYHDLLDMDILYSNEKEAAVKRNSTIIIIKRSETVGIDTGIYLGVDNPYDLHRRLIDEGVIFIRDPERIPLGVRTSFLDDDGNVLNAIEMNAELRL